MSQPDLNLAEDSTEPTATDPRGVLVPKPQGSIDTLLLGIAAGAVFLGCVLLAIEMSRYGWQYVAN